MERRTIWIDNLRERRTGDRKKPPSHNTIIPWRRGTPLCNTYTQTENILSLTNTQSVHTKQRQQNQQHNTSNRRVFSFLLLCNCNTVPVYEDDDDDDPTKWRHNSSFFSNSFSLLTHLDDNDCNSTSSLSDFLIMTSLCLCNTTEIPNFSSSLLSPCLPSRMTHTQHKTVCLSPCVYFPL